MISSSQICINNGDSINIPGFFIEKLFLKEGEEKLIGKAKKRVGFRKKLIALIIVFFAVSGIAALTYFLFENFTIIQAIYYGVTTATGLEFLVLQHTISKVIATVVLIGQWVCLWLAFELVVGFIAEGRFKDILEGGHIKKAISKMKGHFIVCGAGRVGLEVANNLKDKGIEFVVVERDPEIIRKLKEQGYIVIEEDGLEEVALEAAGVKKAKTIITAFGKDADNVFLTLTAKELNPAVRVIARAEKEESVHKLKQAGAVQVVLPCKIGGEAMANAAVK